MSTSTENPVVAIFREWNALFGHNKCNLPNVSDRTHGHWFNQGHLPTAATASTVAAGVWQKIHSPGSESLRKNILAAAHKFVPSVTWQELDEHSFPAAFFNLADGLRKQEDALLQVFFPYLGTVADKCWQLVTRGIIEDNTNPLRLGQVYVCLDTMTPRPGRQPPREAMEPSKANLTALEALLEMESGAPTGRVVLVGEPGSGKSTFFQFVTLCLTYRHSRAQGELARKHFADLEKRVPGLLRDQQILPFRILLREFGPWLGSRAGTADEVVDYLQVPLTKLGYQDAASRLPEVLERGLAFVLFDGLDEVPRSEVSSVKAAITGFAQGRYQKCRVAVTCRTESYKSVRADLKMG